MEEGTKAFVKEVKALPKAVRDEDCFKVPLQPAFCSFPCLAHTPVRNKLWHSCLERVSIDLSACQVLPTCWRLVLVRPS